METLLTYRGKAITQEDVVFIRDLIAQNPGDSRWSLSHKLCQAWNWRQANGALRDMVCRGLMLALERAGYIELPAKKRNPLNPLIEREKPTPVLIDPQPIEGPLSSILPLEICQVRRSRLETLCNSLIEQYHYLGYCQPVGEHLKYLIFTAGRPVACMIYSSAPRHIGCRDRFIGWPVKIRRQNLHLIAYQTRFLILPWVKVPHLASHLLGRMAKRLSTDWRGLYQHPVYFQETFVDLERFKGTCYEAANWLYLGKTTGRGKNDHTYKPNRSIKAVWGYPLCRDFRVRLCEARG
jgi:Druantia protein DruA